jgi:MoaA/NifB/PqqE/SkfB family radical SAM enzyme
MVRDVEWTADAKPLMFLDLKLGYICNLKCRICGSWSSSTFAVEEITYDISLYRKNSFHYTIMRQGRWPRESAEFWKELEYNLEDIRYLEFTGGEPFMIDEHFDLLQHLVDKKLAHQIEIHYNTNGTIFPAHAEDIWQYFKHVEIAFSIDDIAERFEYQRSGAKWDEVNTNIRLFQNMRDRNLNMSLQICCTVNVFNVMYLDQVAAWIDTQDVDYVYWNMLHDAPYFSIATLPESVKESIAQRLRSATFPSRWQRDIDQVIEFMLNGASQDGELLKKMIRQLDIRRDQNLIIVAPELAGLIQYV